MGAGTYSIFCCVAGNHVAKNPRGFTANYNAYLSHVVSTVVAYIFMCFNCVCHVAVNHIANPWKFAAIRYG